MDHFVVEEYDVNSIMPNLGFEVEDFQSYTWQITGWRDLEKKVMSPKFKAGGRNWRIFLYPYGKINTDTAVSIYLGFDDPQGVPTDWHSCVQFAFFLWNPEEPTLCVSHHAHHRFTVEEPYWGFNRFCEQRNLFVTSSNHTRSLIESNACNITACVRIIKDPTGILWHNFTNYDSRKVTGYVGLKNQGATGSLNVSLQLLYCISYLRKAIYQIPTEEDESGKSVSLAIQRIFHQLQTSNDPVETVELTKSYGWTLQDCSIQRDFLDIFKFMFIGNLRSKMNNTKLDGVISELFCGKIKHHIKCTNIDYQFSRIENYEFLTLDVLGCKNLVDSFNNFVQEVSFESNYYVSGYGLQDTKKSITFESFPPILNLVLRRWVYIERRETVVKINDLFEYPMEIDLQNYLSFDADKSKPHKYSLHGVVIHDGDKSGGLYYQYLRHEKNGKWIKFFNDKVTPATVKEVLDDNYGGGNKRWFPAAYVLTYIRESDIDDILPPVFPEDVPKHLQRRIDEEKALCEQKRKEDKERLSYLYIKVVTKKTFKNHQGFGLVNFENRQYQLSEVLQFKVKKSVTYKTFKSMIAAKEENLTKQIRFWVLVNRQNNIRTNTPITDNCLDMSMEEIYEKMASKQNELILYLEITRIFNKTLTEKVFHSMIFVKYFDPRSQSLRGLCHIYVPKNCKADDIVLILREKKKLASRTPLKIYKEIKPNRIQYLEPKVTYEMKNGDIICFQKELSTNEMFEYQISGLIYDIPTFYDILSMRIVVQFKPKVKDCRRNLKFELVLNRKYMYDVVAKHVAAYLNTDPLKLLFTTAHPTSGTPECVIKRKTNRTLAEILENTANFLYYETLNVSITDLETKMIFKVVWLGTTVKEKEIIEVYLPRDSIVNDIFEEISKKLNLTLSKSKIRLYDVMNCKILNEYESNDPIDKIQEHFTILYAEEIPKEEVKLCANDRIVQVHHFTRERLRLHGIPFKFVIKAGELLSTTKLRLQTRLGMNEKDFSKVKIAIIQAVSYTKPHYIDDDNFILSDYKWTSDERLGLDYVDTQNVS
ncbi:cysteine proteinase [Gigaspora margarita]|uniref:ubiquitinyl hydrolase 1 n=1 Tax=Gigaspora margarita TaxID=4874 RepID=A0A8H4EK90_GIGMA|nr:cysteine proteinase [Gigaspora margarita]